VEEVFCPYFAPYGRTTYKRLPSI